MGRPRLVPPGGGLVVTPLPVRGEVWWCQPLQLQRRPVVVLSRNAAIPRLQRVLVAPCTTNVRWLPSEVPLEPEFDPIPLPSVVNLDSVESVAISTLEDRLGMLSDRTMRAVCEAMSTALDFR